MYLDQLLKIFRYSTLVSHRSFNLKDIGYSSLSILHVLLFSLPFSHRSLLFDNNFSSILILESSFAKAVLQMFE